jgi:hypothetical protein
MGADELVADLQLGTVKTLKAICEQLIDKGAISREILLSDLVEAQKDASQKAKSLAAAVPSLLYAELGGKPLQTGS